MPFLQPKICLPKPTFAGSPSTFEVEAGVERAVVGEFLRLLDLVELDEPAECLEIDALVEVFHLGLEFEVGELAALEVTGHVGEFAEPGIDGRLHRLGEQVARPEHLDQPEGDRRPDQPGVKLAAGLHGGPPSELNDPRVPRRESTGHHSCRLSLHLPNPNCLLPTLTVNISSKE